MESKILELIQLQSSLVTAILLALVVVLVEAAFDFIMCIISKKWNSPFGFKSRGSK